MPNFTERARIALANASKAIAKSLYDEERIVNEQLDRVFKMSLENANLRENQVREMEKLWEGAVDEVDKRQLLKLLKRKEIEIPVDEDDFMSNPMFSMYNSSVQLASDRKKRYMDYADMADSTVCSAALDIYCFTGDTLIPLLDGSTRAIKDLVGMDEFWVYSVQDGRIMPGRAHSAHKTGEMAPIYKVTLDNGKSARCTANHLWLLRDGSYKKAVDLLPGDSLMPLYRKLPEGWINGYEMLLQPSTESWEFTHILSNHKVVVVEPCGYEDVYDFTVDEYHNFAIDIGVFVHNSGEAFQYDPDHGATIWVTSPGSDDGRSNEEAVKITEEIEQLFDELEIEDNIFGLTRKLAQMGDEFEQVLYNSKEGVVGLMPLDPESIEVEVDKFMRLKNFKLGTENRKIDPWAVVHFKIKGRRESVKKGGTVYGYSLLESARRVWRQLKLLEDALIIYRLDMAVQHRVWMIDTGSADFQESLKILRQYRKEFRKRWYYDVLGGTYTSRHSPLSVDSDIYLPLRTGSNTRVEYIGTGANVSAIMDVEYFTNQLHAALKIPKAYLGYDQLDTTRAGLTSVDINFARMMRILQRAVLEGLHRIALVHLAMRKMYDPDNPDESIVELHASPVSVIEQTQHMEILRSAVELAQALMSLGIQFNLSGPGWTRYILGHILGLSDSDLMDMGIELPTKSSQPPQPEPALLTTGVKNRIKDIIAKRPEFRLLREIAEANMVDEDIYDPSANLYGLPPKGYEGESEWIRTRTVTDKDGNQHEEYYIDESE